MASAMKVILVIALTMALSLAITMRTLVEETEEKPQVKRMDTPKTSDALPQITLPSKRTSRFLVDNNNPRAVDNCNRDGKNCTALGQSYTCCNNKCVDLSNDKDNCGRCNKKCKYTYTCCSNKCVDLTYDKRNCGSCGERCATGDYCFYGMCNYN